MEWINVELKGGHLMFDSIFVFKAQCCLVWNWNMEIVELKVSSFLLSLLEWKNVKFKVRFNVVISIAPQIYHQNSNI